ncbi:MAG: hypothetical protein IJT94_01310 [Oscillibacter sp.]|nr:hypothetical protein [Oscillibacter sp.]
MKDGLAARPPHPILKQNIHSGDIPHTQKQTRVKTEKFMDELQKHPEHVAYLFPHKQSAFIFYRK